MSQRLRFNTAQDLFDAFPTLAKEMSTPPSDQPALDFVRSLERGGTPEEAITFMAFLLSRREAVWWGHQCLSAIGATLDEADWRFLDLAENWVREPEEEQRVAALEAASQEVILTPGGWIALAAAWSGGSMVAGTDLVVPPPADLTAQGVYTGILAGLAGVERAERAATLATFVDMGVQLIGLQSAA